MKVCPLQSEELSVGSEGTSSPGYQDSTTVSSQSAFEEAGEALGCPDVPRLLAPEMGQDGQALTFGG